jgi:two-component system, OmpR family, sensor histidine kinase ChvG
MNDNDLQSMSQILRHRLRGIAAGIRGALELIEEEGGSQLPPGLLEYFPLMIRECDALQEIAGRLSLFFDAPPPTEPLSADVVTLRAIGSVAGRFPSVTIRSQGSCEARVSGWMEAAVTELIVNAGEAAPNGSVEVRFHRERDAVVWTVSNFTPAGDASGAGCADPFAPFATTRPRHLGLGLPIARRLSERAGGHCALSAAGLAGASWAVEVSCPALDVDSTPE